MASSRPYIVMAYCAKDSLAARLRSAGALPWEEAVGVGVKLAGALETAHRCGILHRDVKPGNVLVSDYGEPQLTDFGIAHVPGGFETASGVITGLLAYAAPESIHGAPASAASDTYALGATLFHLISGCPPFESQAGEELAALLRRITTQRPPDLRHVAPNDVCAAIERAMAADPQDRYASTADFGRALQESQRTNDLPVDSVPIQQVDTSSAPPPPEPPSTVAVFEGSEPLAAARAALERHDWARAYDLATSAVGSSEPTGEALEVLAEAAWWTGRLEDCIAARERAYRWYERTGDRRSAGRCAWDLHEDWGMKGNAAVSAAWLGRARRALADEVDCPEYGFLLVSEAEIAVGAREVGAAPTSWPARRSSSDAGSAIPMWRRSLCRRLATSSLTGAIGPRAWPVSTRPCSRRWRNGCPRGSPGGCTARSSPRAMSWATSAERTSGWRPPARGPRTTRSPHTPGCAGCIARRSWSGAGNGQRRSGRRAAPAKNCGPSTSGAATAWA